MPTDRFMLDQVHHQAAGLRALALHSEPRIVAMASHADRRGELPLLWQLCSTWATLGYPVLVLDATVTETAATPGLLQLLLNRDDQRQLDPTPGSHWPIVPAALGLAQLYQPRPGRIDQPARRARQLADLFPHYELIVLYAPAQALATLLPGSGLSPLLPVSNQEVALLTAYQSLKQMLKLGQLQPTIVAVMDDPAQDPRVTGHRVGKNLQDCAREFLSCEVAALTVSPDRASDVQRLALRIMESAMQPIACSTTAPSTPVERKH